MKFPLHILGKKVVTTAAVLKNDEGNKTMTNLNILDRLGLSTLHRSQSVPSCSHLSSNLIDNFPSTDYKTDANRVNSPHGSVLDINSNVTLKHRGSIGDSSNTDSLDKIDTGNGNNTVIKRISFDGADSVPWEDSGCSSCGCLSDDKDDLSLRSHDFSFDCDDACDSTNCRRSLSESWFSRIRSCSLDSASSDISESSEHSKLSSSFPSASMDDYSYDNGKLLSYLDQSKYGNSSSVCVLRRKSFTKNKRRSVVRPQAIPEPPTDEETESDKDNDLNNNRTDMSTLNLHSRLKSAPFQLVDTFQNHGLISFVGCVCYTMFLVFLLGVLGLVWQIVKRFVRKSDLKELRDNVIERRYRSEMMRMTTSSSE